MTKDRDLYKSAGVDTEMGDALVDWLQSGGSGPKKHALGEVVSGIGGFAALFRPNFGGMRDPLLVSSTDGVGTKIILALEHNELDQIGIDLVAMCVNDIYTVGAQPLFFLDYYATGKLSADQFKRVLAGIKSGVQQSGAVLLGGETAELPGLYKTGDFDLAGFVVGVVDAPKMLGAPRVQIDSLLYAVASTGFHSNGYSLARHWLDQGKKPDAGLIENLLAPTKIYSEVPTLLEKLGEGRLQALANITGGGISGNLPRVIPNGMRCVIERSKLPTPPWMRDFIAANGASFEDVEPVFNLGAGMVAVVHRDHGPGFESASKSLGLQVQAIGKVVKHDGEAFVEYQ